MKDLKHLVGGITVIKMHYEEKKGSTKEYLGIHTVHQTRGMHTVYVCFTGSH